MWAKSAATRGCGLKQNPAWSNARRRRSAATRGCGLKPFVNGIAVGFLRQPPRAAVD